MSAQKEYVKLAKTTYPPKMPRQVFLAESFASTVSEPLQPLFNAGEGLVQNVEAGVVILILRLQPIKEVASMLKRRFENIITYLRHQITNAASESLNAKIQWVKYTARGFRNKQNFMHAIYFHCGGLDLAPSSTK